MIQAGPYKTEQPETSETDVFGGGDGILFRTRFLALPSSKWLHHGKQTNRCPNGARQSSFCMMSAWWPRYVIWFPSLQLRHPLRSLQGTLESRSKKQDRHLGGCTPSSNAACGHSGMDLLPRGMFDCLYRCQCAFHMLEGSSRHVKFEKLIYIVLGIVDFGSIRVEC